MAGFGFDRPRSEWTPRKAVTDWRVLLLLGAQLVAMAYSYGQLNERVTALQQSMGELRVEVQQMRGGH